VFEAGRIDAGSTVDEAADGVGEDVAAEPPVLLHPAIPKTSTTSPAANEVRTALQAKRWNCSFGYGPTGESSDPEESPLAGSRYGNYGPPPF